MTDAVRDQNYVPVALGVSSADNITPLPFSIDPVTGRLRTDVGGGGSGTVTSVSVVSANGFAGSVANATTTPAITISTTITGIVKGNGTAISAAVANTDYQVPVILTTTGSSGAATFNGTTLNIPVYSFTNATTVTVANEAADSTCFVLFVTAATGDLGAKSNAGLVFDSTTARLTATLMTATTSITSASVLASSNDSGALGASGTAFADLFLASGGVINWNAANATITHSAGLLTTNVPVTITGVATADGFAPTSTTATGNRMYLPAANTLGFAINGSGELQLTSTALSPISDDGLALGTTALGWQSLFGDTGFVINIENGDWVATHTAGILTVGTGDLRVTNAGTNSASAVTVGGTQTLTSKTLSAATFSGSGIFAENGAIFYDAASSADGVYNGFCRAGTAGTTLAFGDLVYLAAADSRWELADADAATTSDRFLGMCVLAAANDGDPTNILLMGFIRADAAFPSMTVGSAMYVGETAGDIQVAIPTGADNVIRRVGYAWTADELYFNPSMDSQITVA